MLADCLAHAIDAGRRAARRRRDAHRRDHQRARLDLRRADRHRRRRGAPRSAAAGERTGELVWRLPLHPEYAELIKGRYADIANAVEDRKAGSITAAEFLKRFVGDVPWAHLDIAGVA